MGNDSYKSAKIILGIVLMVVASAMTGCDNHIKYVDEQESYEGYSYELIFHKDDGKNLTILHKTFLNQKYLETKIFHYEDCIYFNSSNWECSKGWYSMIDGEIYSNTLDNHGNMTKKKLSESFYIFD